MLDLENVRLKCTRFPQVILSSIHLTYLALNAPIIYIPPSISDLLNLETLIMVRHAIFKGNPLPDTIWKMKSLRHVNIDYGRLYLGDLAENESHMAAYNVESLGGPIFLGDDPQTVEFLRRLPRLRELNCCGDGEESPKHPIMWFSLVRSLSNLEELKIKCRLFRCNPLKELPTTCSIFPQNLKKLTLSHLRLSWCEMSTIGKQLPNLEVLKLLMWACRGNTWSLEDREFSKLRYLKLNCLNIRRINVSVTTPFPASKNLLCKIILGLRRSLPVLETFVP